MSEILEKLNEIRKGEDPLPLYKFQYFEPKDVQQAAFLYANWHIHLMQLLLDIQEKDESESRWIDHRMRHLLGLCEEEDNLCLWCAGESVDV